MSKISNNIEKELLEQIISELKKSKIEFYHISEDKSHKSCYFDYEGYVYFIHSFNSKVDVINRVSIKEESTTSAEPLKAEDHISQYKEITIYSDGGCEPNPGESGCGIGIYSGDLFITAYYGLYIKDSTNNIAELNALNAAMEFAQDYISKGVDKIVIKTDSQYSIKCMTEWIDGWLAKNWKTAKKEPVKNKELIEPMYNTYKKIKNKVSLEYVKSHVGIEGNEVADSMASRAILTKSKTLVQCNESLSSILKK